MANPKWYKNPLFGFPIIEISSLKIVPIKESQKIKPCHIP